MRRFFIGGLLVVGLIVFGFISLLRGCLSKYDERSALAPSLFFEKNGQAIVLSIVKFDKTTSYQQNGGMIHKSVSTSYSLQTNDGLTGKKILEKKIKKHKDIKNYPIEVIAGINQTAWVFIGELMAFDPFTLTLIADIKTLEEKNPPLKGRLPKERKYYEFNQQQKTIQITITDGSVWVLDAVSLIASAGEEPVDLQNSQELGLEKLLAQNRADQDSLMERKFRRPSRMLAARQISLAQYNKAMTGFSEERNQLSRQRDSLDKLLSKAKQQKRSGEDMQRIIDNLRGKVNTSFSQIKTNMDTIDHRWYGLYTGKEMEKLYEKVQYQPAYDDPARRQLFQSSFGPNRSDDLVVDKANASILSGKTYFLNGGFLLNKNTGMPIRLQGPSSLLVVYKDQVGNEGKIQISRLGIDGASKWTFDTHLKEWADWLLTDKRLYVFGTDQKELSSNQVNVLYGIDLINGKTVKYDYFTDKLVE